MSTQLPATFDAHILDALGKGQALGGHSNPDVIVLRKAYLGAKLMSLVSQNGMDVFEALLLSYPPVASYVAAEMVIETQFDVGNVFGLSYEQAMHAIARDYADKTSLINQLGLTNEPCVLSVQRQEYRDSLIQELDMRVLERRGYDDIIQNQSPFSAGVAEFKDVLGRVPAFAFTPQEPTADVSF